MKTERLKGNLDLLILSVLLHAPAHGYAIVERLRERSDGAFDLPEGTVYPALHRLERAGLLRSRWSEASGRRRRVYEVSALGAKARRASETEWHQFSAAVNGLLGWSA